MAKQTNSDRTLYGILSYLWIFSIIPLLTKKSDKLIYGHAKQGFVIFIIWVIIGILNNWVWLGVLHFIYSLVYLLFLILMIAGMVKASQGKAWRIPVIADLADKF